jgi:tetratricopeptide (TPR) repeat protein
VPALLACSAGEFSYEHPRRRHGAFLDAVLRGLLDAGGATLPGLAEFVRKDVAGLPRRPDGSRQTPELVGGAGAAGRPPLRLEGALAEYARGVALLEKAEGLKAGKAKDAEYARAAEALDAAVRLDGKFVGAYLRRAEARFRIGKTEEAAEDCRQALDLDPDDATAHAHHAVSVAKLGEAAARRGERKEALARFKEALSRHGEAIRLEPAYAQGYNERGQTYFKANQLDSAIDDFTKALGLNPRLKWAYFNRGYARFKGKDFKKGIDDQTRAVELDREFTTAWYVRGLCRLRLKDYGGAVEDLTEVIRQEPKFAAAYTARAAAHDGNGDGESAARDRETAQQLKAKGGP